MHETIPHAYRLWNRKFLSLVTEAYQVLRPVHVSQAYEPLCAV